jgi:hypothetical protein
MFQGFYIVIEDCDAIKTHPNGWSGRVLAGTPIVLTYFDEYGMEFLATDISILNTTKEFRLKKPCPIIAACSCDICGKIVATVDLENHKKGDDNCSRISDLKHLDLQKEEAKQVMKEFGF